MGAHTAPPGKPPDPTPCPAPPPPPPPPGPCTADGPHWGGSPIWGALGNTVAALLLGAALGFFFVQSVPLPAALSSDGVFLFLITLFLGFVALYLK